MGRSADVCADIAQRARRDFAAHGSTGGFVDPAASLAADIDERKACASLVSR